MIADKKINFYDEMPKSFFSSDTDFCDHENENNLSKLMFAITNRCEVRT